jgi:hypothetical protein
MFDLMPTKSLSFHVSTLLCIGAVCSLWALSSPASAVVVTVNGTQYDLGVFEGPYLGNESIFSAVAPGETPWWGNEDKAIDFATQVFDQLLEGTTPGNSPLFAFEVVGSDVNGWSSDVLSPNSLYFETFSTTAAIKYAIAKEVPGPLPLLGIGAAFGYSRVLRKRIKRAS